MCLCQDSQGHVLQAEAGSKKLCITRYIGILLCFADLKAQGDDANASGLPGSFNFSRLRCMGHILILDSLKTNVRLSLASPQVAEVQKKSFIGMTIQVQFSEAYKKDKDFEDSVKKFEGQMKAGYTSKLLDTACLSAKNRHIWRKRRKMPS